MLAAHPISLQQQSTIAGVSTLACQLHEQRQVVRRYRVYQVVVSDGNGSRTLP